MPILKRRWSILGPKGLSIQWRSLQSPPASFSMISLARRSPVKRLNPSQVRFAHPFTVLLYQPSYSERSRNNGTLLFIYHFYKRVCFFLLKEKIHICLSALYWIILGRFAKSTLCFHKTDLGVAYWGDIEFWHLHRHDSRSTGPWLAHSLVKWNPQTSCVETFQSQLAHKNTKSPHTTPKKKKILAAESYNRVQMDTM